MALAQFRLENSWHPLDDSASGGFTFTLFNLSSEPVKDFRIVYTSLTRTIDKPVCGNAVYLRRNANFHEFAPPTGFVLEAGKSWRFTVDGLLRPARHRTDGAKSAYISLADGTHRAVDVADLMLDGRHSEPAPALLPEGKLDLPFAIQPWPAEIDAAPGEDFPSHSSRRKRQARKKCLRWKLFRRCSAGFLPLVTCLSASRLFMRANRFVSSNIAVWKLKVIACLSLMTPSSWNIRPLQVCNTA